MPDKIILPKEAEDLGMRIYEEMATDYDETIADLKERISNTQKRIDAIKDQKKEMLSEFDENTKKLLELPPQAQVQKMFEDDMSLMLSDLYLIRYEERPAEKCPYCDENRMITLHSPDGQDVKTECSCGKETYRVFYVIPARKERRLWLQEVQVLALTDDPAYSDGTCCRIGNFDKSADEMYDLMYRRAYTAKEKAIESLRAFGKECDGELSKQKHEECKNA